MCIEARDRVAEFLKTIDHATHVIRPVWFGDFLRNAEIDYGIGQALTGELGLSAVIRHGGDDDVAIDRERHHKAIAVVDVFADQIDASGCGRDDCGGLLESGVGGF